MNANDPERKKTFLCCRLWLDNDTWLRIVSDCRNDEKPDRFLERIRFHGRRVGAPKFLQDLARLEWHIWKTGKEETAVPDGNDEKTLNPSLCLIELDWKNLAGYVKSPALISPEPGKELVMIWKHPEDGDVCYKEATPEDLLILKMISEGIDRREIARLGALPVTAVDAAIERAGNKGIILASLSLIRRAPPVTETAPYHRDPFLTSTSFTLQWHLTQACELHCRHCYDRSDRSTLTQHQALGIIDDLDRFCRKKHVRGHISFTGGNPLLHPDFNTIYKTAADYGFTLAILGNPTTRERLDELSAIQKPDFFQVSLEGLHEYNNYIRGEGHFERSVGFLALLQEMKIYSMVMLTLTKDNIQQVIPLGEYLQGRTDAFFFNRLALVGEGASLALPPQDEYVSFLKAYLKAAPANPVFGLKDNLFNALKYEEGVEPFGGCTGFGCGAAFNFLAVLPDGEVHACRKFPSAIGNIFEQSLEEIYDSDRAGRYRTGCAECGPCVLKPVCGGCLASSFSHGLNIFEQKDPYCFLSRNVDKQVLGSVLTSGRSVGRFEEEEEQVF